MICVERIVISSVKCECGHQMVKKDGDSDFIWVCCCGASAKNYSEDTRIRVEVTSAPVRVRCEAMAEPTDAEKAAAMKWIRENRPTMEESAERLAQAFLANWDGLTEEDREDSHDPNNDSRF